MSSLIRRLQKRDARKAGPWEPKPRAFKMLPDGGYMVLRPTKGWLRVSGARLRAQRRLADMAERLANEGGGVGRVFHSMGGKL